MEGFLLINKPAGITSFSVIYQLKKLLPKKTKIGHAGTLDAFATGLLVVGISRGATKVLGSISNCSKTYKATGKFGWLTDTLDPTGQTIKEHPAPLIDEQLLHDSLSTFMPSYIQVPPIFSALKSKGKRLSDLRRYKQVDHQIMQDLAEQKAREVKIYALHVLSLDMPFFTISAHVSHGTYIRSLVYDSAQLHNSVATTTFLERASIGPLSLQNAVDLSELDGYEKIESYLISIQDMQELLKGHRE